MAESKQARSGLPAGAVALNKFVPAFDGRLFMVSATSDGLILLHNADQIFVVNMPFVTDLGVRNCGMVAAHGRFVWCSGSGWYRSSNGQLEHVPAVEVDWRAMAMPASAAVLREVLDGVMGVSVELSDASTLSAKFLDQWTYTLEFNVKRFWRSGSLIAVEHAGDDPNLYLLDDNFKASLVINVPSDDLKHIPHSDASGVTRLPNGRVLFFGYCNDVPCYFGPYSVSPKVPAEPPGREPV